MQKKLFLSLSLLILGILTLLFSCTTSRNQCYELFQDATYNKKDVIIVPGVPYEGKKLSKLMIARIVWAKFLFEKGITNNIIFSGSSTYTPYYEAKIMALYALELGIPGKNIFIEIEAKHSTENIYYSYLKAKELGFNKIALATDPYQSKLLRNFIYTKIDKSITLIPIIFDSLSSMEIEREVFMLNDSLALNPNFIHIKEQESFIERIKGTLGKNVNINK